VGVSMSAGSIMAETLEAPVKGSTTRSSAADLRTLAEVEKWMAVIREIKQAPAKN
jgi:hypothetical protein